MNFLRPSGMTLAIDCKSIVLITLPFNLECDGRRSGRLEAGG
jgi:hypothetical protein